MQAPSQNKQYAAILSKCVSKYVNDFYSAKVSESIRAHRMMDARWQKRLTESNGSLSDV